MPEDRTCGLRLIHQTKRQIGLDQTMQRLWCVGRGLKILNNHAEPVCRCRKIIAFQIVTSDFHFLGRQMIKGQVELQDRRPSIFAVWVVFDHPAQRLQRLKRQPLVTANFVDLIIIAQRQKILRIGRIIIGRIKIDKPLRGGPTIFVVLVQMVGIGLHDQGAFGVVGIRIKPLDFGKVKSRIIGRAIFDLIFATLKDLTCSKILKLRLVLKKPIATAAPRQKQGGCQKHRSECARHALCHGSLPS